MSEISDLTNALQKSGLDAECPKCGKSSALSNWLVFDGLEPFPSDAEQKKQEMEKEYQLLREKLKKKIKNLGVSKQSAFGTGMGNITETVIPAMKKFGYSIEDCRFLAKPIDYIIFDGTSKGKIDHITFMDIKTGTTANLSPHQKKIRDAVKDNNVKSEII